MSAVAQALIMKRPNLPPSSRLLTSRRKELSLTQAELARRIGYKNSNFISMLESGASIIPLEKTSAIATALELEAKSLAAMLLKERFPDLANVLGVQ